MGNMGEIYQNMGGNMGNMGFMGNIGGVGSLFVVLNLAYDEWVL